MSTYTREQIEGMDDMDLHRAIVEARDSIRDYTINIEDAWPLLEEMREDDPTIGLGSWWDGVEGEPPEWVVDSVDFDCIADPSPAAAICKAWLLWRSQREEQG